MNQTMDIGRTLDNKYQIIDSLGKGGMADVWLARDERLGKLWAIKEIKKNVSGTRGELLRQSIIDEAHFMKRLDHPAIPRVVDIMDMGAEVYVVMDYVEGRQLGTILRETGEPFDQKDVIKWGIELCDVLGYLHSLEPPVVYRDMKPSNVMLKDDNTVKLIDFGICMECDAASQNDGRIVGTPGYAPPEQIPQPMSWPRPQRLDEGVTIDPTSDVYALGATLYTLVTGHVPQKVRDTQGHDQVVFQMRPIRTWNPRLSEGLERILLRATQEDQRRRYATMGEMRYDLEHHFELTEEWRNAQRTKITVFRRWVAATVITALCGVMCVAVGKTLRVRSYEDYMREGDEASCVAVDGGPSDAERAYCRAIEVAPERIEPYEGLIKVYEHDFRFTDEEDDRWRRVCAGVGDLRQSKGYAQLCFDVGILYLSYYGTDRAGGSVGNAAIASVDAAAPWFERVIVACDDDANRDGQSIDEADVRASSTYLVIARFYETVTRAGKEGRGASAAYADYWEALSSAIEYENSVLDGQRSAEGIRARLCQVATEALSSSTYLAGFSRAGVTEQMALSLVQSVQTCLNDLDTFANAEEYGQVYRPVFAEINSNMGLARQNIQNVYANPVESLSQHEEGERS